MSQVKHRFAARMDGIAPFHVMAMTAQALEAAISGLPTLKPLRRLIEAITRLDRFFQA